MVAEAFWAVVWSPTAWGLALVAFLVFAGLTLRRYIHLIVRVVEEHSLRLPRSYDLNNLKVEEAVFFRATDGHELAGWLLPRRSPHPSCGTIIFAHEFGSNAASCDKYADFLRDLGYDLFTFDFRGHGLSSGQEGYRPRQWPSDREYADMVGAIRHARRMTASGDRMPPIAILGLSRGASAAILAAAEDTEVRCVVTDSAFSTDLMLEFFMRRFATIFATIKVIARNHPPLFWRFMRIWLLRVYQRRFGLRFPSACQALRRRRSLPICMIQGSRDSCVPVEHARTLYEIAPGPKSLWIVEGARHNQSAFVEPQAYQTRILEFLDLYLADPRPEPTLAFNGHARPTAALALDVLPANRPVRVPAPPRAAMPAGMTNPRP